jgi:hypothetical protein
MQITEELLKKAGYKEFHSNWKNSDCYIKSFQKRFDDELGKKYFITLDMYDYSKRVLEYTFDCDSQMYIERDKKDGEYKNEITFNVNYFVDCYSTIEEMEQFFEKIWLTMSCRHYEKWS